MIGIGVFLVSGSLLALLSWLAGCFCGVVMFALYDLYGAPEW